MNMYNTKEKCTEVARRFERMCEERGTTPYKIARYSGLSSSTVSCFLSGKTIPKLDTMLMLCNSLGISMTDIFDEREVIDQQTQEEKDIIESYRNLPEQKKEWLRISLRMLTQYTEE